MKVNKEADTSEGCGLDSSQLEKNLFLPNGKFQLTSPECEEIWIYFFMNCVKVMNLFLDVFMETLTKPEASLWMLTRGDARLWKDRLRSPQTLLQDVSSFLNPSTLQWFGKVSKLTTTRGRACHVGLPNVRTEC